MITFMRFLVILAIALLYARGGLMRALAQNQSPPAAALENPLAEYSLDRLSATRERPLFATSRRPPILPPAPAPLMMSAPLPALPTTPPPSITLVGIILEADEARAVVHLMPKNSIIRIRIGEEIAGWKVSQIERRKVVLSLNDRTATFTLFNAPGRKALIDRGHPQAMDKMAPDLPTWLTPKAP
jgi:hypothetical protein